MTLIDWLTIGATLAILVVGWVAFSRWADGGASWRQIGADIWHLATWPFVAFAVLLRRLAKTEDFEPFARHVDVELAPETLTELMEEADPETGRHSPALVEPVDPHHGLSVHTAALYIDRGWSAPLENWLEQRVYRDWGWLDMYPDSWPTLEELGHSMTDLAARLSVRGLEGAAA